MKKVVYLGLVILSAISLNAQEDSKKGIYGFNLGINSSQTLLSNANDNINIQEGFGFQLGVLAEFQISELVTFMPRGELSFYNSNIDITLNDGVKRQEIMPVSTNFMTHLVFRNPNSKKGPYFYFGPNYMVAISPEEKNQTDVFPSKNNLAIDLGVGWKHPFEHFNFAPELKYSYGLLDINSNPSLDQVRFHNISMTFNFLG